MACIESSPKGKAALALDARHVNTDFSSDKDVYVLARVGKKQVLKRRFGLLSISGLASATMISWESAIAAMSLGLANGGPAGLFWGFLVCWLGAQSAFITMGELASMAPTAGGSYHWCAILFPPRYRSLAGYVTGWINAVTWIISPTALAYISSNLTLGLVQFINDSYTPAPWHGVLVMWAFLATALLFNTIFGALLPAIELLFLALHIIGFFAFIIPMATLAPRGNAYQVVTQFSNTGDWATFGLAFLVGLQGNASALLGTDSAVHMAEETRDAEINVPRAMSIAVFINGSTALIVLFCLMYFAGPLEDLESSSLQFPFIQVIYTATQQSQGATIALTAFIILMNATATLSTMSSGSRMLWAFSRDRGVPMWRYIMKVDKRYALPMVALGVITTCSTLLGLIQLGSSVVLSILLSLNTAGFMCSYLCAMLPLLYHRIKGNISDAEDSEYFQERSMQVYGSFTWGPWRIKGIWGTLNNIFGCSYLVLACFFCFWPTVKDVTPATMNYSSLLLGGAAIISAVYYWLWARRTYDGPVKEVNIQGGVLKRPQGVNEAF